MKFNETSFPLEITLHGSQPVIGLMTVRLLESRLHSVVSHRGTVLLDVEMDVEEQWLGEMSEHLVAAKVDRISFFSQLIFRELDRSASMRAVQVVIERCSIPNSLAYTVFAFIDGRGNKGPCETIYDALVAVSAALGLEPEVCGECKYCELSPYGNMADFFQGVCHKPIPQITGADELPIRVSTFHMCEQYASPRLKIWRRD
jgi:hypothetical protein